MKITAVVHKIVEIELEVDDKFAPLTTEEFWEENEADTLADELEEIIENSEDDIVEVRGVYDSEGYCMFEN